MKKQILLIIPLIAVVFLLTNVEAACRYKGYAKDTYNEFIDAKVSGYCKNTDELIVLNKDAGELWLLSWGGPADTCESYCGEVFILIQNDDLGLLGFPDSQLPSNQDNSNNWDNKETNYQNATLLPYTDYAEFAEGNTTMTPPQNIQQIIVTLKEQQDEGILYKYQAPEESEALSWFEKVIQFIWSLIKKPFEK